MQDTFFKEIHETCKGLCALERNEYMQSKECIKKFLFISQILEKVGFADVIAQDRTEQFVKVLKKEKERTENASKEFLKVS